LEYHKENRKKGRLCGQTKIRIRFEKTVGKWFDWMMVSKEEMNALLEGTGWETSQYIDSENSRYIAVIQKKPD